MFQDVAIATLVNTGDTVDTDSAAQKPYTGWNKTLSPVRKPPYVNTSYLEEKINNSLLYFL